MTALRLDAAILALADNAILWAWNQCSIPRIAIIRAILVLWVVYGTSVDVLDKSVGAGTWVKAGIILAVLTIEELLSATLSPRVHNTHLSPHRASLPMAALRLFMLFWVIGSIASEILTRDPLAALEWIISYANVIFSWTYTPEDPPAPKRRSVLRTATQGTH